jgi:rfaE bifunctional protein kinase chain/domain
MLEAFGVEELEDGRLASILDCLPHLSVAVFGDFFLDKYLVIDRALSETSLETGLESYQVVAKRSSPGAAGTVTSNLRALGVGRVEAIGVVGDDGEGYEMRQALAGTGVGQTYLLTRGDLFTPTYTKPMLRESGVEREIERLDVKNRVPMPRAVEDELIARLEACLPAIQGVMIADQVQARNQGVVTDRVRARLVELARANAEVVFFADSRTRIGEYREVVVKPNRAEAAGAVGEATTTGLEEAAAQGLRLSERTRRLVYLTLGQDGVLVCDASRNRAVHVAGVRISGEVDVVGAGDSAGAGIVSGLCAGASPVEAAAVGNLVASITVQQLGTTGTASPEQVAERLKVVLEARHSP